MVLSVLMSLSRTYNSKGHNQVSQKRASKPRKKRPAPFSIRLSETERASLAAEAAGAPLGAYIKAKALGQAPLRMRRTGHAVEDRQALAQALALIGKSRIANNLNQLAYAVNIGSLPMTPETEEDLRETLLAVQEMRRLLMAALGMKVGEPRSSFANATEEA